MAPSWMPPPPPPRARVVKAHQSSDILWLRRSRVDPSEFVPPSPECASPDSLAEAEGLSSPSTSPERVAKRFRPGWDVASPQEAHKMDLAADGTASAAVGSTAPPPLRIDALQGIIGGRSSGKGGKSFGKGHTGKSQPPVEDKRKRQVYVGNLAKGSCTEENLTDFINVLFRTLPEYLAKYPDEPGEIPGTTKESMPVVSASMMASGSYAFVELRSDELALTALKFAGASHLGSVIQVGRPAGGGLRYNEWRDTGPGSAGLDVTPLQEGGLLPLPTAKPAPPVFVPPVRDAAAPGGRELYFGNLASGAVTKDMLMEMLAPACENLLEYEPSMGPPIVTAHMPVGSNYCVMKLQSDDLAAAAFSVFGNLKLAGRRVKVGWPEKKIAELLGPAAPVAASLPLHLLVPPIPGKGIGLDTSVVQVPRV